MTELPDRLLRDALDPAVSPGPSTPCVDVERLAAWADGTMTGAERAVVETHAAGCASCLALLAAMTRTEPPPIAPPWWRRSPIAWLVPLAAVTAGLVIVVGLATLEQRSTASLPTAAPAAKALPHVNVSQAAPPPAQPPVTAVASKAPAAARRQRQGPGAAETGREAPAATEAAARDTAAPKPEAAPAPPPAPAQAPPSAEAAVTSSVRDQMAGGRGGGRAFAAQATMNAMKAAAGKPSAPIVIASSDRDAQWRIVYGAVEHTIDGGATWQPQSIGVATPIKAGAAPDARVCWLAGVAGVVLRTTDGTTWTRIPFPESADLVAIQAGDASHASVTTAAGRRFATSDGGATWTPQ